MDLSSVNSDYIGWINIKNTTIEYPIVKGKDNEFYLTRDFRNLDLFLWTIKIMDFKMKIQLFMDII